MKQLLVQLKAIERTKTKVKFVKSQIKNPSF
jgi:hypothetical protein